MTTRILLVRHGDTGGTQEDRFTGERDVPLTDEGRLHSQELGERLATLEIHAVYASPMQRARDTAGCIAQHHSLSIIPLGALREVDHGEWDGLTRAEAQARYPDAYAAYDRDPFHNKPPGGESGEQVLARAAPALDEIVRTHPSQNVVVVAHKTTNRVLIAHLVGIDPRGYRDRFAQRPACLNVLDFGPAGVQLALLNDVSHYHIGAPPHTPYAV